MIANPPGPPKKKKKSNPKTFSFEMSGLTITVEGIAFGQPLPTLSKEPHFGIRNLPKYRHAIATICSVPVEFEDVNDALWNQSSLVKRCFKKTVVKSNGKSHLKENDLQFPACLILEHDTLVGRLCIMNWWSHLKKDEQKVVQSKLKDYYVAPTLSGDIKDLRNSAEGAVIAANRGMEPTAISMLDDATLKRNHHLSSRSARAVANSKKTERSELRRTQPHTIAISMTR